METLFYLPGVAYTSVGVAVTRGPSERLNLVSRDARTGVCLCFMMAISDLISSRRCADDGTGFLKDAPEPKSDNRDQVV